MRVVRLTQSDSPDAADADERLLQGCREGSEEAFATLVSRYETQLTRHCARLIGAAAAQDAVQDAFLSAWVALQAGAEVRAARPWLFTIAHRKALAALRDQRRAGVELSETAATSRSPEDAVAESAHVRRAFAALAALPGAQRHALLDSAVHGRSGTQIANSLGISESAVRQLVFKARASVRTAAAACLVPPLFVLAALRRALSGAARRASALH
ncbi:MAG: RNA polymerase sigma factor, partial [Solirubrobacteraceae bacterium]